MLKTTQYSAKGFQKLCAVSGVTTNESKAFPRKVNTAFRNSNSVNVYDGLILTCTKVTQYLHNYKTG